MRHLGRRLVPPRAGFWTSLRILAAGLVLLCGLAAAQAREVTIRGIAERGFGRIELAFDEPTKVRLRNSGTVLVLAFDESVRMRAEKLPAELSAYVSASRRDPDGSGLRLALTRAFRTSQLEAGEKVFIDLLPEGWTGLPPGLPPEVVAELAERARRAEEKLKARSAQRGEGPRPVVLRLAQTAEQTSLVFEPPAGTAMRFKEEAGATTLRLDGPLVLDLAGNRPKAAEGVADFSSAQDESGLSVRVEAKPGRKLRSFLDDGTAVIDLLAASPDQALPSPAPAKAEAPAPPAQAAPKPAPEPAPPARRQAAADGPRAPDPFVLPPDGAAGPAAAAPSVRPRPERGAGEPALVIPFRHPTPAAAFERGGRTIVVFQTSDPIDPEGLAPDLRAAFGLRAVRQQGSFTVLAFDTQAERPLRLLPVENGWRLALGGAAPPPDDVLVTRAGGADGRGEVMIGLAGTGVHWLLDPEDVPLAVVTTSARQGLANPRRFVDFQLPQTIQGAVVQPNADEVQVALGRGAVLVRRKGGLALSLAGQPGTGDHRPFVIRSDDWNADVTGDVLPRYRAFVAAAAEAPRADKARIRFATAHLLLANGLAHEAASLLAVASADDPLFARRRETLLLSGIAAARAYRPKQARAFLSDETLGTDPEAALWLAELDAEGRDWCRALAGFRRAEAVLAYYPDELTGAFRLSMARAAAATGDVKTAEDVLAAIERLPPGSVPRDEIDLVRAEVDEAAGRATTALAGYERLARAESRPMAAAATLRAVRLGRKTARMPAGEAIPRLETLSVSWRGDEIELGAIAELVHLYGEVRRWRDMFTAARLVQFRFPNSEETRRIYDEAVAAFEALFLGRDGETLDAVEYLALYYDFKQFAPAGRRGDEIVRRIADRLVEIDLLDQAAALLQHQVDHRLTGLARATIATRLAALRLMSGKPALAVQVLQATRMSELPAALRRLRLIVEAQAQADLSRVDLALEAVEGEEGPDFARLRATIYFGAGRWREAGEAFEGLVGTRWKEEGSLTDEERRDVVRAMLADLLGEEWMALDRIRAKFAAKMADSPDAKTFEALLRPQAVRSAEFRAALREASRSDSLRRFLGDWSRIADLPSEPEPPARAARAETPSGPG